MQKISVAIIGFGNIGRACKQAIEDTPDMILSGVVRRNVIHKDLCEELQNTQVVSSIKDLKIKPDVVLLCIPTREVIEKSAYYRNLGYNTVDSFDEHSKIFTYKRQADIHAKATKTISMIGCGWDPGTDSAIRKIMDIIMPSGKTTTTFGGKKGGRSMGHTAFARAVEGVKDAVALTLAHGRGAHKRIVYVELEKGYKLKDVKEKICNDSYFASEPTEVKAVESIFPYNTLHHEADIERTSMGTKQRYLLSGNNPEMAAYVMVACARAVMKAKEEKNFGAYTLIERPLIDFISGEDLDQKLASY